MKTRYDLERRKYVIALIACAIAAIYIVRLFILQVADSDYKKFADSNAFLRKTQYPARGLIYDRNDKLVVYNQLAYDVMMIMREVTDLDTADFCRTLGITVETFEKRIEQIRDRRLNPGYSSYTPQVFLTQLSVQDYGRLQEKLYKYKGFYIQSRMLRQYAYPAAANVVGNIREVSPRDIENDDYYRRGDYTGDLGVEKSYERVLRGEKGEEILLRDAHGRIKGRFEEGAFDKTPVSGKDIRLSLDIELQQYGEYLMQNKIGAIVAIEPESGEILAFVSSPSYDPSLLVGRSRGANYLKLNKDPLKPLYDRALMASYPPGSTFKPTQGMLLLEEGIINEHTVYPCYNGFVVGGLRVGCHAHGSPLALEGAIQTSCNAYFCYGLRSMLENRKKYTSTQEAFNVWKDYLVSMGYGYRLGVDLPGESRGFIPNSTFYSKVYKGDRWRATTIISVAIGQGEVLATPLQICNLAATIANRGWYVTPHVVRAVRDTTIDEVYRQKHRTKISPVHYEPIVAGMRDAVLGGTCRLLNTIPEIEACGKTGTAQNPHGKDHSAFMGFAPMNCPKIAIAVYVENAGFGATYGVPIGALMMEKYLTGQIAPERQWIEERMVNANTIMYRGITR